MHSFLFTLAFAIAATQAPAADATTKPGLTLDAILTGNAAARGGVKAWRAVESMTMSGKMDTGQDMQLPYRLELKRPNKMRLELDFEGKTSIQTYDGKNGYKLLSFLSKPETQPMSPEELEAAAAQAELDGPLIDHARKGNKVALVGREEVDGRDAYQLAVTMPNGVTRKLWLDAETLLEAKVETSRKLRGSQRPVETFFRDYRKVNGVVMPYLLETRFEGAPTLKKMTVDTVELNPPLDDQRFAKP